MILTAQLSSSEGFVAGCFIAHLPVYILKLVIQPLITYCCLALLGLNGKLVGIVVLIIAMPTGIIAYIIAEKHHVYTQDAFVNQHFQLSQPLVLLYCYAWVVYSINRLPFVVLQETLLGVVLHSPSVSFVFYLLFVFLITYVCVLYLLHSI